MTSKPASGDRGFSFSKLGRGPALSWASRIKIVGLGIHIDNWLGIIIFTQLDFIYS
jgi:hypothetical protein